MYCVFRKARRYWAIDGGVVGDLLCFDRPQTLVQVRHAYQRHYGVYTHCDHAFAQYLAHTLLRLAEHGLACIEPAVPFAPGQSDAVGLPAGLASPHYGCSRRSVAGLRPPGQPGTVGREAHDARPNCGCQPAGAGRTARRDSQPISPVVVAHCLLGLAEACVRGQSAVVAVVLREEVALPFAGIVTACQEYRLEHVEDYGSRPPTEVDIAVALLRHSTGGMARLLIELVAD